MQSKIKVILQAVLLLIPIAGMAKQEVEADPRAQALRELQDKAAYIQLEKSGLLVPDGHGGKMLSPDFIEKLSEDGVYDKSEVSASMQSICT